MDYMWVDRRLFDLVLEDNRAQQHRLTVADVRTSNAELERRLLQEQKAKDDITIDWLRNRVNALEKERTILWQRASGIALPTPEIEISKPKTVAGLDLNSMPSFEDVGDDEAGRLGIEHDLAGELIFKK